jgi:hypothetical protein
MSRRANISNTLGIRFHFSSGPRMAFKKRPSEDKLPWHAYTGNYMTLMLGLMRGLPCTCKSSIVGPSLFSTGATSAGKLCMQLNNPANSSNLEVEQVHRNFMRYVLRVCKNTSTWVVLGGDDRP